MIHSVLKAIDILSIFSPSEPRLSLAEISQRLSIPKSTAHNLLATLLSRGLIEHLPDDRYALGSALIGLTQSVRVNIEIRDRAAPLLRQLADSCKESSYLTVRERDKVLYIYAVESPRRLLARTAVGDHVPMHCTSVGKAILSLLPEDEVVGIASRSGLPTFTENTIVEVDQLLIELRATRERGFSIDNAEHELNVFCIGAAIIDSSAQVVGACSVSGTDPEIIGGRMQEISTRVLLAAEEISRRMGYVARKLSQVKVLPF